VILDEIRAAEVTPLHLPMPRDPRARRVAEALRREPGDTRRLDAWSRLAGASERTLERLFRSEVGMSFGAWRQQARLLRGLEHLAAGDSVSTAALRVGFQTPSAFIAMFRRAMGTTPGRYFRTA
jgi:AraC-like DNA-binding protein